MPYIKKIYGVQGMTCASCARNVETVLSSIDSVRYANVNLASNTVLVEYEEKGIPFSTMQNQLSEYGYILKENLAATLEQEEWEEREKSKALFKKVVFAAVLTLPVFILSMFFHHQNAFNWLMLLLTIPVVFVIGKDFFVIAGKRLKHLETNMDTLVSLGTGSAFLFSLFNTLFPQVMIQNGLEPHVYYEAACVIITLILLGRYLEDKAKQKTRQSIKKLLGLAVKTAIVIKDGREDTVPIEEVHPCDVLLVRQGDRIPVDGKIIEGSAYIDESMISGESVPAEKKEGDSVIGSTILQSGTLKIMAERVGEDTVLSNIIRMVKEAQGSKARIQQLADKISSVFVPVVIVIALLSFSGWMIFGEKGEFIHAFVSMVSVLIIACPCALGLATPTAIMVGVSKAAENGILIRDASSLEMLRKIDVVLLDKTGTITYGKPIVCDIFPKKLPDKEISLIYTAELLSSHPLAKALVDKLKRFYPQKVELTYFSHHPGKGIELENEGVRYWLVSLQQAEQLDFSFSENIKTQIEQFKSDGRSIVCFASNGQVTAVIAFADKLRESASHIVEQFIESGVDVHIVSGDNENAVRSVAKRVGVQQYQANMLPKGKLEYIKMLQSRGLKVAMVGDGINDAPALAKADVGIAIGTGTDIAIESAPLILVKGDLNKIKRAFDLSKRTIRVIRQNFFWAFIYNVIGITFATGILYSVTGIFLNPMIGAAAMAFSSVSVVMNSLRLRKA